jgi:hypothetical protein
MSEVPIVAPPVPPPPAGTATLPRIPARAQPPVYPGVSQPTACGTVAIRVRPRDADVRVDGESWTGSVPGERLIVELTDGVHQLLVQKSGFSTFAKEFVVRAGETTPPNVSLTPEPQD